MSNSANTDRVKCAVAHCNRTKKRLLAGEEFLCKAHWQAVPKLKREYYTEVKRLCRRGKLTDKDLYDCWCDCKDLSVANAWAV